MISNRNRDRRGIAASEFALLLPVLTLVVAAVIDLTEYLTLYKIMAMAARNGALDAAGVTSVSGMSPTNMDLEYTAETAVEGTLSDAGYTCGAACAVDATWEPSTTSGWSLCSVEVTWQYTSLTGLTPLLDGPITARFTTLTQYQP